MIIMLRIVRVSHFALPEFPEAAQEEAEVVGTEHALAAVEL